MAAITRFEDIEAWQHARTLAAKVYSACRTGALARDFGLRDQMQRAAVSIMANIAEGYGRQGRRELIQFLKIARGSCTELQSHLYLALDADLVTKAGFTELQSSAEVTGRKISGFIHYLSSSQAAENTGKVNEEPDFQPTTNNQ